MAFLLFSSEYVTADINQYPYGTMLGEVTQVTVSLSCRSCSGQSHMVKGVS